MKWLKRSMVVFGVQLSVITSVLAQNVGINTTAPQAMLHVDQGSILVQGPLSLPQAFADPPTGLGWRMFWYNDKGALRVGYDDALAWQKDSIGLFSSVLGYASVALGHSSTALGIRTRAIGESAFVSGYYSIASGHSSTAMGSFCIASGVSSAALGGSTEASGNGSLAIGNSTQAKGDFSISTGFSTEANGHNSVAMGRITQSNGANSLVIGEFNDTIVAQQNVSDDLTPLFIIGNGSNSFVRANAMVVRKNGRTGIGTSSPDARLHISNGASGGPTSTASAMILEDDDHFYLSLSSPSDRESGILSGSGTSTIRSGIVFEAANSLAFRAGGNTTRMLINASGDIGIGTGTPSSRLHISEGTGGGLYHSSAELIIEDNASSYIQFSNPNGSQSGILSGDTQTHIRSGITFNPDSTMSLLTNGNTARMTITETGNVGIGTSSPTERLHVVGDICYTGAIGACSDQRYKIHLAPLEHVLSRLEKIDAYHYDWDIIAFPDKGFEAGRQLGVIAQEMMIVFPEVVLTDQHGYHSVDYAKMSVILLAGMKEQQVLIQSLEDRLAAQEETLKRLEALEDRLSSLENLR